MKPISRVCRISGASFEVSGEEQEHIAALNRLMPYLGAGIPLPEVHPSESLRQLMSWGAYLFLCRGKSILSGKPQLTRYHPSLHPNICTNEEFWSDAVDNTTVGRPVDFTQPFFPQIAAVLKDSILFPLTVINCEDCSYVNGVLNGQRCYLCFNCSDIQDCLHCFAVYRGNDNVCCVRCNSCQYCYQCLEAVNCYECQHCEDCQNCSNCIACLDCIGCSDCFGCFGLRNVRYCFNNKQLSPGDYQRKLDNLALHKRSEREVALKRVEETVRASLYSVNHLINVEESSGYYLKNCKNVHCGFFSYNAEDCGYIVNSFDCSHCWRSASIAGEYSYCSYTGSAKELYNYYSAGGEDNILSFYLMQKCSFCFGCVALKNKCYCILNRQYTKEEYFELILRIVRLMKQTGEWGSFLPPRYAPFAYENSIASLFLETLPPEELKRRGYRLVDIPADPVREASDVSTLPEIDEAADETVLGKAFRCPISGRSFNIQRAEFKFHQKMRIPLPRMHSLETISQLWDKRTRVPDSLNTAWKR